MTLLTLCECHFEPVQFHRSSLSLDLFNAIPQTISDECQEGVEALDNYLEHRNPQSNVNRNLAELNLGRGQFGHNNPIQPILRRRPPINLPQWRDSLARLGFGQRSL